MAFDPATIGTIVGIGQKLYEFIKRLYAGETGDPLRPILEELTRVHREIAELGQTLLAALEQSTAEIVENQHLEQLVRLLSAHDAITDYLRYHNPPPETPDMDDINYALARGTTTEVVAYFTRDNPPGTPDLFFMGDFVHAMNVRLEFITGLHPCWFGYDDFVSELRGAVDRLSNYINQIKSGIRQSFRVTTDYEVDYAPLPKPHVLGYWCSATVTEFENIVWVTDEYVPKSPGQPGQTLQAMRHQADQEKSRLLEARQVEVMGDYDQILARWNGLLQEHGLRSMRRALLRGSGSGLPLARSELNVNALREAPTQAPPDARAEAATRYVVPLREPLLQILLSPEFERRQKSVVTRADPRVIRLWFAKAFHREPTSEEESTLVDVWRLFGHKSLFSCALRSREYESRYGEGLPTPVPTDLGSDSD